MIMEYQTADVGNKMKKIDFGPHRISSLAVWRSWCVRLKRRLSSECLYAVFMWACVQDPVSQCAHRDIKHYHRSISKGGGYGLFLFAGVCLSSVTVREHKVFHMWPQWDQNTDSWEAGETLCNLRVYLNIMYRCILKMRRVIQLNVFSGLRVVYYLCCYRTFQIILMAYIVLLRKGVYNPSCQQVHAEQV